MIGKAISAILQRTETKMNLVVIALLAFLCAVVIARSVATKQSIYWLETKKQTAIACSIEVNASSSLPADHNNGNGCAHQTGTTCMVSSNSNKRNRTPG